MTATPWTTVKRLRMKDKHVLAFELSDELADLFFPYYKESARKHGDFLAIQITLPFRPRSTGDKSQNHHFNGHVDQLALAQGATPAVMKKYLKIRAALEMDYPVDKYEGVIEAKSEADASVEECHMLIEMAHIHASEIGVTLYEREGWSNE